MGDFKCDRPTSLGMNIESLAKIFKMCGPNDSLKLAYQSDADTLNFQCESSDDDRIADFDLKRMQIESEHMEIPEQQFKVVVKMPSGEFQNMQGLEGVWRDHDLDGYEGRCKVQCRW